MLKRVLLMSVLLVPAAAWGACISHKVGTVSLDCTAFNHELNNPEASGVSLELMPEKGEPAKAASVRVVRPHEFIEMDGTGSKAAINTPNKATTRDKSESKKKSVRKAK